jgi:F0F1-type ATP synthase assembly protein I
MFKKEDSVAESLRGVAPYMGLGIQLAATITIMVLLGDWLDSKFETNHWIWVFSIFGMSAGLYNFIKTVLNLEKKQKKKDGI